jgi:hypothetical protein
MKSIQIIRYPNKESLRSLSSKESMLNMKEHFTREGDICTIKNVIILFLLLLLIIVLVLIIFK